MQIFKCSECNCEIKKENGVLVCPGCGQKAKLPYSKKTKIVDMNPKTKDLDVILG